MVGAAVTGLYHPSPGLLHRTSVPLSARRDLLSPWSYDTTTTHVLADGRKVKTASIRSLLYERISGEKIKLKHPLN